MLFDHHYDKYQIELDRLDMFGAIEIQQDLLLMDLYEILTLFFLFLKINN